LNFQFLVFDHVEELDLVGSWELVGLLAEQKQCNSPKLVTLNTMTPVGEHGMRFIADAHFSEAESADVILVPGGSGSRIAMEDLSVIAYLQEQSNHGKTVLSCLSFKFPDRSSCSKCFRDQNMQFRSKTAYQSVLAAS
jgi:cyclohexyl-isocyanide hydratase